MNQIQSTRLLDFAEYVNGRLHPMNVVVASAIWIISHSDATYAMMIHCVKIPYMIIANTGNSNPISIMIIT